MNPLMQDCCKTMINNFERLADEKTEFEAKRLEYKQVFYHIKIELFLLSHRLFGTVTMDVIASVFFGMKIDSQNNPDNPFVKHAKRAFVQSFWNPLLIVVCTSNNTLFS